MVPGADPLPALFYSISLCKNSIVTTYQKVLLCKERDFLVYICIDEMLYNTLIV